jgi:hypothetical protein
VKRHAGLTVFLSFCGGFFLIGVVFALAKSPLSHSVTSAADARTRTAAPAAPAAPAATEAAAAVAKTVATFSGSGIQNTSKFTVTGTWKLSYSFDCTSFGYSGNFQVYEDGGDDLGGVSVNDLAMTKSSSTWAYDDGGTHYLEINSECSWTVKVIDEG